MQTKMKIWKLILLALLASQNSLAHAEETTDPRFKAVMDYLLQGDDYPELFDNKPYRMKVTGLAIGDLDGDEQAEVVLSFKPHYRQSPSIMIFRIDKEMQVTRVVEGLAPGPLVPVSGDYLDSHTLGVAVDLEISKDGKPEDLEKSRREFVRLTLEKFGGVVAYSGWYHVDGRGGRKMYLDMTHAQVPNDKHDCAGFEFSTVDDIQIATKETGRGNYLLAFVGDEIYAYKIHKFLDNGMMEKSVEIFPIHRHEHGE